MVRALPVLALLVVSTACARNPVTGKRQLALISERQEIALGSEAREEIIQSLGLYPDEAVQAYVAGVGQKLARGSERPKLPWSFEVLDDASINAFALPGGPIFITRGLLTHLGSEAELAAVLGHEMGHVTARHAVNLISKQQLAQVGLGVGSILLPERLQGLGDVAGVGAGLLFLRYGRDAERQSDELAWDYALRHGYDVRALKDVFTTLGRASESEAAGRLPQWLSTHPDPQARVRAIEERLREAPPPPPEQLEEGREALLARLEGMTFGHDPRQGYFEGNAFLHPGLKFQVAFPPGWRAVNQARAVVGVSPRQDAIIQLALVPGRTPEQAAQPFFSQPGIRRGDTQVGTLNALPMLAAYFQAQVEEGVLGGIVTFISHEGRTYQLIAYSAAQTLPAHDAAFRQSISTFGPLTDPKALAAQPARLELVTLPREMTLEEAHAQFPSTVNLRTVGLINGVQEGAVLPARTRFKRVTGGTPAEASTPVTVVPAP